MAKNMRKNYLKDLTGQTYGYLTVIGHNYKEKWNCQCVCGKVKSVTKSNLIYHQAQSCSRKCFSEQRYKEEIGKIYNECKILDIWKNNKGLPKISVLCHCGSEFELSLYELKSGKRKVCNIYKHKEKKKN